MHLLSYLAFFMFGSVAGWAIDSGYRSVVDKRWVNAGYFVGPWCPIYGFGAVLLLLMAQYIEGSHVLMRGVLYFISLSAVELLGGLFCVHVLKKRLWDYSHSPFNLLGHIDLQHSLYWMGLGFVFELVVYHPMQWADRYLLGFSLPLSIFIFASVSLLLAGAAVRKVVKERPYPLKDMPPDTSEKLRDHLLKVEKDYDRMLSDIEEKVVVPAEAPVTRWFDENEHKLVELNERLERTQNRLRRVRRLVVTQNMERDLELLKDDLESHLDDLREVRKAKVGSKEAALRKAQDRFEEHLVDLRARARERLERSARYVQWNRYILKRGRIMHPRAFMEGLPEWFDGWKAQWKALNKGR